MQIEKRFNSFFSRYTQTKKTSKIFGRKKIYPEKILLIVGLFFISMWLVGKAHVETNLSFINEPNLLFENLSTENLPEKIFIAKIGVNLPIEQTRINYGVWEVGNSGISHLITSGTPGTSGNIILYGHNVKDRLGRLGEVKKGDKIVIQTKNKIFAYEVYENKIVMPDDISYLTESNGETLTLYTCTGFADTQRLVVKAKRTI